MRQHLSHARDPLLPARAEEHKHIHPHMMKHVLLLLTWLLPLMVLVPAVWTRTLATASLGTTISTAGGNHNVLSVAPYLVLQDFVSWTHDALFPLDRCA